jgi:hypothetical protein
MKASMKSRLLATWLLCVTVLLAPVARADEVYTDEDSEYLKVASFFLEPVGQLLEWLVFRPIHVVHHLIDPTEDTMIDRSTERVCSGIRPRRECAAVH